MNNTKQNLLLIGVLGIFGMLAYGTFFTPQVVSPLGANQVFEYGYQNGVTQTTSSVGIAAVQVLAQGRASLNEVVENIGSVPVFCFETSTSTGIVASSGVALVQYGTLGNDRSAPYYGGVACITAAGTTTVSVMYK